jgi:hypothetical protein
LPHLADVTIDRIHEADGGDYFFVETLARVVRTG